MIGKHRAWRSALVAPLWLFANCGGQVSSGVGGESHFLCEGDSDCAQYGPGLVCVHDRCESDDNALSSTTPRPSAAPMDAGAPPGFSSPPPIRSADSGTPFPSPSDSSSSRYANVCTADASAQGCPENVEFGGVTAAGRIVSAFWNGSAEVVAYLDPDSGTFTPVGVLGDLRWEFQFIYDAPRNVVYAGGQDANNHPFLYMLSLDTGRSTKIDGAALTDEPCSVDGGCSWNRCFGGMTGDGRIVAPSSSWTGSPEAISLVDPSTGEATLISVLPGLGRWEQAVYDDGTRVVYGGGYDDAQRFFDIYTFSLETLQLTTAQFQAPAGMDCDGGCFPIDFAFAGPTGGGKILVVYWTGSAEAVALTDPATGASILVGYFDGLSGWGHTLAYDSTRGALYAWGAEDQVTNPNPTINQAALSSAHSIFSTTARVA